MGVLSTPVGPPFLLKPRVFHVLPFEDGPPYIIDLHMPCPDYTGEPLGLSPHGSIILALLLVALYPLPASSSSGPLSRATRNPHSSFPRPLQAGSPGSPPPGLDTAHLGALQGHPQPPKNLRILLWPCVMVSLASPTSSWASQAIAGLSNTIGGLARDCILDLNPGSSLLMSLSSVSDSYHLNPSTSWASSPTLSNVALRGFEGPPPLTASSSRNIAACPSVSLQM